MRMAAGPLAFGDLGQSGTPHCSCLAVWVHPHPECWSVANSSSLPTSRHGTREMVCEKDIFPKNRCHIRYLQLFSTVKYKVTLTVTNALGKNSTTLTFDEFAIGNFHSSSWPLRASVGFGLICALHLPLQQWVREASDTSSLCLPIHEIELGYDPCWHLSRVPLSFGSYPILSRIVAFGFCCGMCAPA